MRTDNPCDRHDNFDWSCDDCKNNYQREKYQDEKDMIVRCKVCKKDVMKRTYSRHRTGKFHIALKQALKSGA
jgi:NAD-dependent SIR2 family protein deacetylase